MDKKAGGEQPKAAADTEESVKAAASGGKQAGGGGDWDVDAAAESAAGSSATGPPRGTRKPQKPLSKKDKERARARLNKAAAAKPGVGPSLAETEEQEAGMSGSKDKSAVSQGFAVKGSSEAARDSSAVLLGLSGVTLEDYEEEPSLAVRRPRRQ